MSVRASSEGSVGGSGGVGYFCVCAANGAGVAFGFLACFLPPTPLQARHGCRVGQDGRRTKEGGEWKGRRE